MEMRGIQTSRVSLTKPSAQRWVLIAANKAQKAIDVSSIAANKAQKAIDAASGD